MLTISKPLSAGQAQSYHAEEFGDARENYYTEADQMLRVVPTVRRAFRAKQGGVRGEVPTVRRAFRATPRESGLLRCSSSRGRCQTLPRDTTAPKQTRFAGSGTEGSPN